MCFGFNEQKIYQTIMNILKYILNIGANFLPENIKYKY